ncbi:hypothetical protein BU17DRAFT_63184 [Hysterangium stoloniferum]|nr:hypothetical protein BU17DRAFT_63184 [Hysterangium stoloniferum]
MFPTTPSKKVFTDDMKSSIDTSNAPRDTLIPEDLNLALQNLGSRVRKSVTEGYATPQNPSTPFSSPAKPSTANNTLTPIFSSARDTLNSVYSPGGPQLPLTPSPRKRSRDLTDWDSYDDNVTLESEEDEIVVILGPDASSGVVRRKIKPLKRTRASSSLVDPFSHTAQPMALSASSSIDSMDVCVEPTM